MTLIEEVMQNSAKLNKTIANLKIIAHSLQSVMRGTIHNKPKEFHMMSIHDALLQTGNGRRIVVQVKEIEEQKREELRNIGRRIRSLKELVHYTFVEYPKSNGERVRFDVYQGAKERVRELGVEGGEAYEHTLTALQYAHISERNYRDAVSMLTECPHDFGAYESSDAVSRHS
jgi:hypothetical protein